MNQYNKITFVKSAPSIEDAPDDSTLEVAFVGRSNAGKSSAINAIAGIKGLAKTSKTPGRTQLLNFFKVTDHKYIVDLPGYGYAKVSRSVKKEWQKHLTTYIETRQQLRAAILIMDIRHPLKDIDQQMIAWLVQCDLSVHILLTKADKLTRNNANKVLFAVRQELEVYSSQVTVQLFSATGNIGLAEAKAELDNLFC